MSPVQVGASWLGNTPTIGMKHYLMTTDAHSEAAMQGGRRAEKPAQNPAQQVHAPSGTQSKDESPEIEETAFCGVLQGVAGECESARRAGMETKGFEPSTFALRISYRTQAKRRFGSVFSRTYATFAPFASVSRKSRFHAKNGGSTRPKRYKAVGSGGVGAVPGS